MLPMRIGWLGFHTEGRLAFEALVREPGVQIAAALTLASEQAQRRSGVIDYATLCEAHGVPLVEIRNVNDPDAVERLRALDLDLLFVIGWSQILHGPALATARLGVVGAHASFLPHNRGSAPVNWAILRGECGTGNSLMWLREDVDGGDIIDQMAIPITPFDTCATIYDAVARTNRDMILGLVAELRAGRRPGTLQRHSDEPLLPRRRPQDGVIDWTEAQGSVYDFVRALTRPYPGAFSWLGGRRWTIWETARLPVRLDAPPGTMLGSVVSPREDACGQAVATGRGVIVILEMESDDGELLRGRALAERELTGQRWDGQ